MGIRDSGAIRSLLGVVLLLVATDAGAGRWRFQSPAEPGLYAVGHSVFEATDPARDDRTIPVDLWVPVDPESAGGTPSLYELVLGFGPLSDLSFDDAEPIAINGFPLVVYSHGGAGFAVEALLGDYRGRPWDDRADVWIILARRRL